jgi:hypothetical protein
MNLLSGNATGELSSLPAPNKQLSQDRSVAVAASQTPVNVTKDFRPRADPG